MLIGVKREKELAENLASQKALGQDYWSIVKRQFRKNKLALWSLRILFVLLFIALTADFLANEKPFYCKLEGKSHFPIFKQYAVDLGLSTWEAQFFQKGWSEHDYERVILGSNPLFPEYSG